MGVGRESADLGIVFVLACKVAHGLSDGHAAELGMQIDDRTAVLASPVAIPEVLLGIDDEAGLVLIMQRALRCCQQRFKGIEGRNDEALCSHL
jgi:hypothetical protein